MKMERQAPFSNVVRRRELLNFSKTWHWTRLFVAGTICRMDTSKVAGDLDESDEVQAKPDEVSPAVSGPADVTKPEVFSETCVNCGHVLPSSPRPGPFGFGLVRCETCKRRRWYPLSRGVRVFYWIVLATTAVGLVGLLGSGIAAVPGAAAVIAAVLLSIDANLRGRHLVSNAIGVAMTSLIVFGVSLGLFAVGAANGYTFEVVDRPAQQVTEFTGIAFERGSQICGGGSDYQSCAFMHAAMYNSVCRTSDWPFLTPVARETCGSLGDFVDDVLARSSSCGYGCTTIAGAEGRWGWSYLRPVAVTTQVTIDRVTHLETCWFDLGPVKLGNCPRE